MVCVDNISKLNCLLHPLTHERYLEPGNIQPDLFTHLAESVKALNISWEKEFNTNGYQTPEIGYTANQRWVEMSITTAGLLSSTLTALFQNAYERGFRSLSPTGSFANLYKAIEEAALAAAAMHSGLTKAPDFAVAGSAFKETLMKITADAETRKHISEFSPKAALIWDANYLNLKPYCPDCGVALAKGCMCSGKNKGFLASLASFAANRAGWSVRKRGAA